MKHLVLIAGLVVMSLSACSEIEQPNPLHPTLGRNPQAPTPNNLGTSQALPPAAPATQYYQRPAQQRYYQQQYNQR